MWFENSEAFAAAQDEADPLRRFADAFAWPLDEAGKRKNYLCGNSLGLMPLGAREHVGRVLDEWATLGVAGHFAAKPAWANNPEVIAESLARVMGAKGRDVGVANTLSVNIHLMLASFYRPSGKRKKILVEYPVFQSDTYALKSHLAVRGFDWREVLVEVHPREGEVVLREEDLEAAMVRHGDELALVYLVNYFTGQFLDLAKMVVAAHGVGAMCGFDLAHAAGNTPCELDASGADFAVWCNYKYLNAGPGSIGALWVNPKHGDDLATPRFAGWWGASLEDRFLMHLRPDMTPLKGAAGFALSTPPALALVPLAASLELFGAAGFGACVEKSRKLTAYLEYVVREVAGERVTVLTPGEPERRGAQLSLAIPGEAPKKVFEAISARGVVCDFRVPNVIRVAPTALYNGFGDVYRFGVVLRDALDARVS